MTTRKQLSWIEIIQLLGSIASVTGISLLWIRQRATPDPITLMKILTIAIVVFLALTLFSVIILIIQYGARQFLKEQSSNATRFAYYTFAIAMARAFIWVLGYILLNQFYYRK